MASPFQGLIEQLRALNGAPRVTYPEGDSSYPTTERYLKIKRGAHLPTFASTNVLVTDDNEPDGARFPNNVLTEHVELEADQQWVHCYRKYERLPGQWVQSAGTVDPESGVTITKRQRKQAVGSITPGIAIGANLVVTDREGGNSVWAYEVETTIPPPSNNSLGTALVSTRTMAYQFPARINIPLLDDCGTALGFRQPSARLVEATIKTYWVISATKPTLAIEQIIPNTIWINKVKYDDVLHDATSRVFTCNSGNQLISTPSTTPSYTQYTTSWVGQQKMIAGDVTPTRYKSFWKVEATFLTMR